MNERQKMIKDIVWVLIYFLLFIFLGIPLIAAMDPLIK